jgi:microcystin-dependent protein
MPFWQWSKTAASNATADPTINWAEGMSPSAVNDSARAMMARLAEFRDDASGLLTAGGSASAFTLTTNQGIAATPQAGQMLAFVAGNTNAQGVTLTVDGGNTYPIQAVQGATLPAGVLVAGTVYAVRWAAAGVWLLQHVFGTPFSIPIGGLLPFIGSAAPNASFVFPFGQAISRATYSTLFGLVGTTYGAGDGSTTFNIPDLRGRAIFGLDNMGGAAANRITNGGSGITGTTVGATGGAESHTLTKAEIPTGLHTFSFNDPGHSHTLSSGNTVSNGPIGIGGANFASNNTGAILSNTTGITASLTDNAGGGAHAQMPPAIVLPYVLRVI